MSSYNTILLKLFQYKNIFSVDIWNIDHSISEIFPIHAWNEIILTAEAAAVHHFQEFIAVPGLVTRRRKKWKLPHFCIRECTNTCCVVVKLIDSNWIQLSVVGGKSNDLDGESTGDQWKVAEEFFSSLNRFLFLQRSAISRKDEEDYVPSHVITNNHDRYEPSQIYWDQDGNLRYGKFLQVHCIREAIFRGLVLLLQD